MLAMHHSGGEQIRSRAGVTAIRQPLLLLLLPPAQLTGEAS
jgi:hypothetical protein